MLVLRWSLAVAIVVASVAVVAVVAVAFARPETFWTVDGSDLARSLEREGDGFSARPCEPRGGGRWECQIGHDLTSGTSGTYVLRVDRDGRCWHGHLAGAIASERRALAGCVSATDHAIPW